MTQAWRPAPGQAAEDAGHEALAERLALEALACPQGAASKPYIAALCKARPAAPPGLQAFRIES